MESKVSEGGLNVTLTIRLLMHGKVWAWEVEAAPTGAWFRTRLLKSPSDRELAQPVRRRPTSATPEPRCCPSPAALCVFSMPGHSPPGQDADRHHPTCACRLSPQGFP